MPKAYLCYNNITKAYVTGAKGQHTFDATGGLKRSIATKSRYNDSFDMIIAYVHKNVDPMLVEAYLDAAQAVYVSKNYDNNSPERLLWHDLRMKIAVFKQDDAYTKFKKEHKGVAKQWWYEIHCLDTDDGYKVVK